MSPRTARLNRNWVVLALVVVPLSVKGQAVPDQGESSVMTLRVESVERKPRETRNLLSPDQKSRMVASTTTARLWTADQSQALGPPLLHDFDVSILGFSPDATRVVTAAREVAYLWNPVTGDKHGLFAMEQNDYVYAAAISPDNKWLATGTTEEPGDTGRVAIWDIATRKLIRKIKGTKQRSALGPIQNLSFSDDGRTLFVGADPLGGR